MKKAVTLYLEEELVEELKAKRYNISLLFNEAMRVHTTYDFSDIEVSAKLSAIDVVLREAKEVVVKRQLELDQAVAEYDSIMDKREQIQRDSYEAQKTLRVSQMIRELNKSIIALEFDVEQIEDVCADMIVTIKELSPKFDTSMHVSRLKNVLL